MYSSSFLLFYTYVLFDLKLFVVPIKTKHIIYYTLIGGLIDAIPTIEDHNVRKKSEYRRRKFRLG